MSFETGYFEDLMSIDTSAYCSLLLFTNDKDKFVVEFKHLCRNALKCYVNLLLICSKNPKVIKREDLPLNFEQVFGIYLEHRHIIDQDKELLKLFFACIALSTCRTNGPLHELALFFKEYEEDYPGNYDLIKLFVIIGKEDPYVKEIVDKNLNVDKLMRKIYSTEGILRTKSLDILMALATNDKQIFQRIIASLLCVDRPEEQKLTVLFNLIHSLSLPSNVDSYFWTELRSSTMKFYNIINAGILSKDLDIQKQAISIIREFFINRSAEEEKPELILFENLIILIETLKEVQSHLVLPSFHLLKDIEKLGPNWYNLVYKLILRHENSLVVAKGIDDWLKHKSFDQDDLDLQMCLLNRLNSTTLYERIEIDDLQKYYCSNDGIKFLADNLKVINWASIPLAIFIQILLKSGDVDLIDACFPVVTNIKHIAIRKLIAYKIIQAKLPKLALSQNMTEDFSKIYKLLQISGKNLKDMEIYPWLESFVKEFYKPDSLINEMNLPDDTIMIAFMRDVLISINHSTNFCGLFKRRKSRYLLHMASIQKYPQLLLLLNVEEELVMCLKPFISTEVYTTDELVEYCEDLEALEKLADMKNMKLTNLYEFNESDYEICEQSDLNELYKKLVIIKYKNFGKCLENFKVDEFLSVNGTASRDKKLLLNCILQFLEIYRKSFSKNCWSCKVKDFMAFIDVGDFTVLEAVLEALKEYRLENFPDQFDLVLIDRIYQEILVYRKSEHFMKMMKRYINFIFCILLFASTTK